MTKWSYLHFQKVILTVELEKAFKWAFLELGKRLETAAVTHLWKNELGRSQRKWEWRMALSDSGGDGINKFLMINFMWSLRERETWEMMFRLQLEMRKDSDRGLERKFLSWYWIGQVWSICGAFKRKWPWVWISDEKFRMETDIREQ